MNDLLQLLIALDEAGLLRIVSDGEHVYAYFETYEIPPHLQRGIIKFKNELVQRLKRPCQYTDTIFAKGVLIV